MNYGPGTGGYYPPEGGGYPPPSGGGGYPPPPPGGGYPPPPPGDGYGGPGFQPSQPKPWSPGSAIGALLANIFNLCMCGTLALVGLILAIVALSMGRTYPEAARTCTIISWVIVGVGGSLWLILMIFYGGAGLMTTISSY